MKKNVVGRSSASSLAVLGAVLLFIACWEPVVQCKEIVRGKVTNVLREESPLHPTTGPGKDLPSSLDVDLRLGGRDVHLRLAKDSGFKPQLPVYVLSTDEHGRLQSHRARLNDTEFAVYQDIQNEGAFGVFREKDANGTSRYKLQGVVHSGGLIYNLKSVGLAGSSPRLRRDAGEDADLKNVEDSSSQEEEKGDGEEFEMNVFSYRAADGADALPAPPSPERPTKRLMEEDPLKFASIPSAPSSPSPSLLHPRFPHIPPIKRRRRRRRQGTQQIYVDVVAMVDYGAYNTWYGRSSGATTRQRQQNALENIRRYYAIVMNGVNLLYKTITLTSYAINVRLVGIVVSSTSTSSPWTEQYRIPGSRWDTVDASSALNAFNKWVMSTDVLPAYDHLMMFTGYDLSGTSGGFLRTSITGLAYTGTVCRSEGQAVSIVEDLGGFQSIGTAAHELGHGLSAEHDGTQNGCRSEDRYIMSAGTFNTTFYNKLNPWRFSSCSVNYFFNFIRYTGVTARGQQCLYTILTVDESVPDVTSLVPGQMYDPDEQCRQVYGPQSRYCRGSEFGGAADICTGMFCFDPLTSSTCIKGVAARGTTCGNQKWCQYGQCVSDPAAPVADDDCVHGDQPGIAFEGVDCETFVSNFPGYCYQTVVRTRCCSSCARHHRLLRGCEYGDKVKGCSSSVCPYGDQSYLQGCCGTCNYGTPFTTTPGTTLPTRFPTSSSTTSAQAPCLDSFTFTVNQMSCPLLVARQPERCYDAGVLSQCCSSCRSVTTDVTGCEYGDRDPSQCAEVKRTPSLCRTLQSVCCKTCAAYGSSSSVVITAGPASSLAAIAVALFLGQGVV